MRKVKTTQDLNSELVSYNNIKDIADDIISNISDRIGDLSEEDKKNLVSLLLKKIKSDI